MMGSKIVGLASKKAVQREEKRKKRVNQRELSNVCGGVEKGSEN